MKKILITGGAGFIGSHLCEYFLKNGFFVTCIDNLSSGFENNIKDYTKNKNFEFYNFDLKIQMQMNIYQGYWMYLHLSLRICYLLFFQEMKRHQKQ